MKRTAEFSRKTKETDITVQICLDGAGEYDIETGIGFFNHMLELFAKHGMFDLNTKCVGDLEVDAHHSVEDTGICLGKAIAQAVGDKRGINRYGFAAVPMDEALAYAAVDVSGRPYLVYNVDCVSEMAGGMQSEMVEEFFYALAQNAGLTLHINLAYGSNTHHIIEAVFKAVARALRQALETDARQTGIPSTKGVL